MRWFLLTLLLAAPAAAGGGPSLAERAREFRSLVESRQYEKARGLMAENARRWWEAREGEGSPWSVGPRGGPWTAWDDHFGSERETLGWREDVRAATVTIRETNDYFRLLERPPVINEVTYYFDEEGKIDGMLVRGVGERPPGRTEEFRRWAREHEPDELEVLMPGGEVDPSDPARFRALLDRWRGATGRKPIVPVHEDARGDAGRGKSERERRLR